MRPVVLMSLLILSATVLSSCNILTPIAIIFAPDPKVEAEYELQDRPTVVFVDDRQSLVTPTSLRRIIADRVSQDLMVKEILTTTISTTDAEAIARQGDTSGNPMPIDAIGRSVGAEQVIYIEVLEFKDRTDRFTPQPRSTCRIRVIDVVNRVRLFPGPNADDTWRQLNVTLPEMDPEQFSSRAKRNQVARVLAEQLGQDTAKLFFQYNTSKLGTNLDG